jgi:hypothetical protein
VAGASCLAYAILPVHEPVQVLVQLAHILGPAAAGAELRACSISLGVAMLSFIFLLRDKHRRFVCNSRSSNNSKVAVSVSDGTGVAWGSWGMVPKPPLSQGYAFAKGCWMIMQATMHNWYDMHLIRHVLDVYVSC